MTVAVNSQLGRMAEFQIAFVVLIAAHLISYRVGGWFSVTYFITFIVSSILLAVASAWTVKAIVGTTENVDMVSPDYPR